MTNPLFYTEALKQAISEEKAKLAAHSSKYRTKIQTLEKKLDQQNAAIESTMVEIVKLEEAGKDAGKLRSKVREIRMDIADLQAEIAQYQKQIGYPEEMVVKKVQQAAIEAENNRKAAEEADRKEVEELRKQITEIEARIRSLIPHSYVGSHHTNYAVRPFLELIDNRFSSLSHAKQEDAARSFINGHKLDLDSYFKPAAPPKGITQTFGVGHRDGYQAGDTVAADNVPKYMV